MTCCVRACQRRASMRATEGSVVYVLCAQHAPWAIGYMRAGPNRAMLARPHRPGVGWRYHGPTGGI